MNSQMKSETNKESTWQISKYSRQIYHQGHIKKTVEFTGLPKSQILKNPLISTVSEKGIDYFSECVSTLFRFLSVDYLLRSQAQAYHGFSFTNTPSQNYKPSPPFDRDVIYG